MSVNVTGGAFREFLMNTGAVRCVAMALLALGQKAVLRMAVGAGQVGMLGLVVFQQVVRPFVAAGAEFLGCVL